MITTWNLHSHGAWNRLCHSCIGFFSSLRGTFLEEEPIFNPDRSNISGSSPDVEGSVRTKDLEMAKRSSEIETDVLIIGGGGAGLAAAVSAAEEGVRVVVAEKCASLGGTTALSIGSITASGTSYQARRGIKDSQADFLEDIAKYNGEFDKYEKRDLCRVLVREAGNTVEWMRGIGFEVFGPSLEPPHRVPRMHNVIPNSWSYAFLLQRAAVRKGENVFPIRPDRN